MELINKVLKEKKKKWRYKIFYQIGIFSFILFVLFRRSCALKIKEVMKRVHSYNECTDDRYMSECGSLCIFIICMTSLNSSILTATT